MNSERLPHRNPPEAARARFVALAAAFVCFASAGCTTYPHRTEAAFHAFQSGQLASAQEAYAKPETTGSEFLTATESGTVALANGDWDAAKSWFTKATEITKDFEDEALVNPVSAGETILSWTINEGMVRYQGEGYERVMIHASLAMAYLAKGDLSGAQVEVRRANALLESEEKLYEKSYVAGGLGHLISAVSYELEGKLSDAYIDYERMIDKDVGGAIAGKAIVRLSRTMKRTDDAENWEKRFGADEERPANAASVVVIAGVGVGPYKREITLPIPTGEGVLQWSVPESVRRAQPVTNLSFHITGGNRSVQTSVVEDVAAVAAENLKDRILWLSAKSAVRAFLKFELTKHLEDDTGGIGQLIGVLFTVITEHADLRAWQTLPDTWQAARIFLEPGRHEMQLCAEGGESKSLGTFELQAGETMFVFARTIETRLFAYPVGGRRVDDTAAAPEPTETP
jgi:hypothetical protein